MEKINVAELLKDCPKGMELDCVLYDDVTLSEVRDNRDNRFPIKIAIGANRYRHLTKTGGYDIIPESKCVIFPKGKTTWEGFVPPDKFKDGDILATDLGSIFILKEPNENVFYYSCYVALTDASHIITSRTQFCGKSRCRLATEEEKQKLFDAIKANGYKWNAETKTLEKLPRFKAGDRIKHIVGREEIATVVGVEKLHYNLDSKVGTSSFSISLQHEWELLPNKFDITTLKPFDKVLVRDTDNTMWIAALFSHLRGTMFYTVSTWYKQCIPFESNEHLIGKADDCIDFYKTWE